MSFKSGIRKAIRGMGFDLVRFSAQEHALVRRRLLLESLGIDLVLDVGANAGQYASGLRELGYEGRIVSFEPLPEAFARLQRAAASDGRWEVRPFALGAQEAQAPLHVAGNSYSSSLLEMLPGHLASAPDSAQVGTAQVEVRTLDALFPALRSGAQRTYLKLDTQGYEAAVLDGAAAALREIDTVQLEMSLAPLYRGEALFDALYSRLVGLGYAPIGFEPGFTDPATGRLLQVDGVFHRSRK
jgi:FkbM family methyltransferase